MSSATSLRTETTHFNVRFENNPKGFYHPNETITGTVELHVEKTIRAARALKLSVSGVAVCAWKKGKGRKYPVFKAREVFLDYVTNFFGREDGSYIEVCTGVHLYNFTCHIPANAVSSYNGTHGSVKYKMTVVLDSPSMPDVIYEIPINILRIESLNDFPWLRRGTEIEYEHQVGVLCCETMPLLVHLKIDRIGYALGETIKITLCLCNQGPAKFKNAIVSLDRVEVCNSRDPEESFIRTRKVVTLRETKSIREFEVVNYSETLIIPDDMPVSSERNCTVFQIAYQVKYFAKSNKRTTVETHVPITITHIPFSDEGEGEEEREEGSKDGDSKPEYDLQSTPVEDPQPLRSPLPVKSAKVMNEVPAV